MEKRNCAGSKDVPALLQEEVYVINIDTRESVACMKGVPTRQDKEGCVADMEQR